MGRKIIILTKIFIEYQFAVKFQFVDGRRVYVAAGPEGGAHLRPEKLQILGSGSDQWIAYFRLRPNP